MATNTKTTNTVEITTTDRLITGANQATLGIMISLAGMVGVWGVACMVSAIARSGGVLAMARNYMAAIGMYPPHSRRCQQKA